MNRTMRSVASGSVWCVIPNAGCHASPLRHVAPPAAADRARDAQSQRAGAAHGSVTLTTLPEMLPAASRTRTYTRCGRLGAYHTTFPDVG